jgi:DNA-binding response OmpR family regulator
MAAANFLEMAGFEVLEAANADDAVILLETQAIRIVFTDVNMPGSIDGLKLAAAVRRRWPPVEIIVTSGAVDVVKDDLPERGVFFPKPYNEREIVAAMQRMTA